jgi:hypothetical protein
VVALQWSVTTVVPGRSEVWKCQQGFRLNAVAVGKGRFLSGGLLSVLCIGLFDRPS